MASIEDRWNIERDGELVPTARHGQGKRWRARYRDPSGAQRNRTFARKIDADRFLVTMEASKLTGAYIDVRQARRTFRDVSEEHWSAHAHNVAADTTRVVKRSRLDHHILPVLGDKPVGAIKPSTMAAAVATWSRTLVPGTVGQVLRQVRQILDAALADGLIASNAAKAVKAPSAPRRRDVHLSDEDVAAFVRSAPALYRALVIVLAGLGLRISEPGGLRVADVDFLRKTVHVRQQRRPGGDMGQLKTGSSERDVPADDAVLEVLAEHVRRWPRDDGLVFSSATGKALSKSVAGHLFDTLSESTRVDASPHSLRHYFGSSLISEGVSVVAVSRWLGHSSPEITWRVYSYLMASDEEVGRTAMAKTMARIVADVSPMCPREVPSAL